MEAISSREAEVSCREEAYSLDPWASDWLKEETWVEAEDTCWAISLRPEIAWERGLEYEVPR
jgi:hypothetical protein